MIASLQARVPAVRVIEIRPPSGVAALPELPAYYSRRVREVAAVVAAADCFVCADSGLMHLSAATDATTVGLFKVTQPRLYAPRRGASCALTASDSAPELVAERVAQLLARSLSDDLQPSAEERLAPRARPDQDLDCAGLEPRLQIRAERAQLGDGKRQCQCPARTGLQGDLADAVQLQQRRRDARSQSMSKEEEGLLGAARALILHVHGDNHRIKRSGRLRRQRAGFRERSVRRSTHARKERAARGDSSMYRLENGPTGWTGRPPWRCPK